LKLVKAVPENLADEFLKWNETVVGSEIQPYWVLIYKIRIAIRPMWRPIN